jgi:hypothetical protein
MRTREDENLCVGNVLRLFDVQYFAAHLRVQTPTRPSGDTALRRRAHMHATHMHAPVLMHTSALVLHPRGLNTVHTRTARGAPHGIIKRHK